MIGYSETKVQLTESEDASPSVAHAHLGPYEPVYQHPSGRANERFNDVWQGG